MTVRWLFTDAAWAAIAPRLAAGNHQAGRPPELRARLFSEAVLSVARTGIPWRHRPREFGHWDAVDNRFRRCEARGLWRQLWARRQRDGCPMAPHLFISTPRGPEKKRRPRGTGFGPLSGGPPHATPAV